MNTFIFNPSDNNVIDLTDEVHVKESAAMILPQALRDFCSLVVAFAKKSDFEKIDQLTLKTFLPNGTLWRNFALNWLSKQIIKDNVIAHIDLQGDLLQMLHIAQLKVGVPENDLSYSRNLLSLHETGNVLGKQWVGGVSIDQKLLQKMSIPAAYSVLLHESTHYLFIDSFIVYIIYEALGEKAANLYSDYCERRSDMYSFFHLDCFICLREVYDQRKNFSLADCYVQADELLTIVKKAEKEGKVCSHHNKFFLRSVALSKASSF